LEVGEAQAGSQKYAATARTSKIAPHRREDRNHPGPGVFKTLGCFTVLTLPPCQAGGFQIQGRRRQMVGFPGQDVESRLFNIVGGETVML
jgi:hypothetical protein